MWLTHYSPSLVRPIDYIDSIKDIFPDVYAGHRWQDSRADI